MSKGVKVITIEEYQAMLRFIELFELVFDNDWEMTIETLQSNILDEFISPNGTFINPKVPNEENNWWNRAGLLESYRHLKSIIEAKSNRRG